MRIGLLLVSISIPLFVFQSILCLFSLIPLTNAASKKRFTVSKSTWDVAYPYEFTQLLPSNGANRSVVNNFASIEEIALIRELLEATEFLFVNTSSPGNIVYGMKDLLIHHFQPKSPRVIRYYQQQDRKLHRNSRYNKNHSSSFTSESSSTSTSRSLLSLAGMKNGYLRRYLAAMATILRIIERVAVYTDKTFGTSIVVDEANLFIRSTDIPTRFLGHQEFLQINHTHWNHNAHCDKCAIDVAVDGLDCRVSTVYKSNLDYSGVLYINEVEGGEFGFFELPKSTAKQRRNGAKYYSSPSEEWSIRNSRKLRGDAIDSINASGQVTLAKRSLFTITPKSAQKSNLVRQDVIRSTGKNVYYDSYLYKNAQIRQYIAPSPGKLVIFSSGIENVHGVTEILGHGTKRYSLNLWLRKADNKQINSMGK